MRQSVFLSLVVILLSTQFAYSQEIPEGAIPVNENIDIPEGAVMIGDNTVFKDENGNKVDFFKFIGMMESEEWTSEPIKDENGKLQYVQIRKAEAGEKGKQMGMPKSGNSSKLIGTKVPDFKMKDEKGNKISLNNTKGKVVVLNFWFTTCKPCISEIPKLNEVYEKYKLNEDVVFASVTFEKEKQVNAFLQQHALDYPIVSDAKSVCDQFNVSSFPTNIIIDRDGNYSEYLVGGNPNIGQYISKAIDKALKNK